MPFHPLFSRLIAFHRMLHGIRYELLLGSLLCVFVLNMLFPSNIYGGIAQFLYLPFQLLAALALFETNRILLRVFLCCAAGLMFCRVAGFLLPFEFEPGLTGLYFAFFAGVTGELFRQLWRMSQRRARGRLRWSERLSAAGVLQLFSLSGHRVPYPRLLFRAGAEREHHERPVLLQLHHHPDRGIRGYRARKLGGQKCHDSRRAGGQHVFAGGDFLHCEPRRKLFTKIEHFMGKML